MTAQILERTLKCYRIGDPNGDYPIFDATGSKLSPGRWNTESSPMIYASEHYSTAMLEKLAHGAGRLPPNQHYIEITIPAGASYEVLNSPAFAGWDAAFPAASKAFGEDWQHARRSLALLVPSVVARIETNVLINADHPEFRRVDSGQFHHPVWWDDRLFR